MIVEFVYEENEQKRTVGKFEIADLKYLMLEVIPNIIANKTYYPENSSTNVDSADIVVVFDWDNRVVYLEILSQQDDDVIVYGGTMDAFNEVSSELLREIEQDLYRCNEN